MGDVLVAGSARRGSRAVTLTGERVAGGQPGGTLVREVSATPPRRTGAPFGAPVVEPSDEITRA